MIKVKAGAYAKLGKLIIDVGRKDARAAVSKAIRRTATTITAQSVKEIRKRRLVKLSAAELKKMFRTRINLKGEIANMNATVSLSNQSISLAKFWARRVPPPPGKQAISKVGYGAALYAAQVRVFGRTQLAGGGRAFLVHDGKGSSGVILMRTSPKRLPVRKLFGPSVSDLVSETGLIPTLTTLGQQRFAEVLEQEIRFRTSRLKGR